MAGYSKRQLSKASTVYIALGVVLIAVMTIVGTSAFMSTTGFIITGTSIYSIEDVVDASGLSLGDNLLFVNARNASESIKTALPFVNDVDITRLLPDTIHIQITESVAVAYIFFAGDYYIIDSSGRVLERSKDLESAMSLVSKSNLIEIRGVEIEETEPGRNLRPVFGTETKLQYMQDVLAALEREEEIKNVSYLDVSNIVNVHFGYLNNKFMVVLQGSTNLRPSNLRHIINNLPANVENVEKSFPNIPGRIVIDESGQAKFEFN